MTNTAITGTTFDIDGGQQLVGVRALAVAPRLRRRRRLRVKQGWVPAAIHHSAVLVSNIDAGLRFLMGYPGWAKSGRDQPRVGAAQGVGQLAPGLDPELREYLAQMPLDGAWADEQPGADL
jgi:hypothetical protein